VPRLLFFTPVLPGVSVQGTAIRAGIALELLAEKYEVTVVHVDMWTGDRTIADPLWPRRIAAAYHHVPTPVAPDAAEKLVREHLSLTKFDAVYVFRLVAAPFALRVLALLSTRTIPNVLDLDDDECGRTEKFLVLRDEVGDVVRAGRERAELHRQRGFERLIVARFQKTLLASPEDRDALASRYPDLKFEWLPNVMRVSEALPPRNENSLGSILFLGTLDYLPNEDAVLYFVNSMLPTLVESGLPVNFRVVGIKTPISIERLAGRPGLTIVGAVRSVAEEYAQARMMVVPLRAASGTRIKILEAFSFGVPVVSTRMGAAGLDLQHEVHLLIADTPEEFAAACLRLITDDQLSATLVANAHAWLRATHSLDRARALLHSLF